MSRSKVDDTDSEDELWRGQEDPMALDDKDDDPDPIDCLSESHAAASKSSSARHRSQYSSQPSSWSQRLRNHLPAVAQSPAKVISFDPTYDSHEEEMEVETVLSSPGNDDEDLDLRPLQRRRRASAQEGEKSRVRTSSSYSQANRTPKAEHGRASGYSTSSTSETPSKSLARAFERVNMSASISRGSSFSSYASDGSLFPPTSRDSSFASINTSSSTSNVIKEDTAYTSQHGKPFRDDIDDDGYLSDPPSAVGERQQARLTHLASGPSQNSTFMRPIGRASTMPSPVHTAMTTSPPQSSMLPPKSASFSASNTQALRSVTGQALKTAVPLSKAASRAQSFTASEFPAFTAVTSRPLPDNSFSRSVIESSATATCSNVHLASSSHPSPSNEVSASTVIFNNDDEVSVIWHDARVVRIMDDLNIASGVRWQIVRGIQKNLWTASQITEEVLLKLRGSNAEAAPKVMSIIDPNRAERTSIEERKIWLELDREEKAILEGDQRGLGLKGDWEGVKDWFGGRIQQRLKLLRRDNGQFYLQLEPLELRKSTRFARFLGSRRLIRVSIDSDFIQDRTKCEQVKKFFSKTGHVLWGSVFTAFFPKDGAMHMLETGDYESDRSSLPVNKGRRTLEQLIAWHNPRYLSKSSQPLRKWVERFSLGLSVTWPVLEFEPHDIIDIDDIVIELTREERRQGKKLGPERMMTDGCGFINRVALTRIARQLNINCPYAVQGRIRGAKGLWLLKDNDDCLRPRIWIRKDSQTKIILPPNSQLGREHLIFDLVAPDRVGYPSRLSTQTVMNLSSNGVPDAVFCALLQSGLQDELEPLSRWEPESGLELHRAIEQAGGVVRMRLDRETDGFARTLGLSGRNFREEKGLEEHLPDDRPSGGPAPLGTEAKDLSGGPPASLYESALDLLSAGFDATEPRLWTKLESIAMKAHEQVMEKFHLPVQQSAEAFLAPDPCDILSEGEIYFSSAQAMADPETLSVFNTVEGDVLIYRNPNRLPSDVRKVKAVDRTELRPWKNVVLYSTKGKRSLPSWLAGGDADGDTAVLVWDQRIVEPFKNSALYAPDDEFMKRYFEPDFTTMEDFNRGLAKLDTASSRQAEVQRALVAGMEDHAVGLYSVFHENAVFHLGYDAEETVRLAHIGNIRLDMNKNGLKAKTEIFRADSRWATFTRPSCFPNTGAPDMSNGGTLRRLSSLPPFVLDVLKKHGRMITEQWMSDLRRRFPDPSHNRKPDEDLLRPWAEAKARQYRYTAGEASKVETFARDIVEDGTSIMSKFHLTPFQTRSPSKSGRKQSKTDVNASLNAIRRDYLQGPALVLGARRDEQFRLEMASCLYTMATGKRTIVWELAFVELCEIKARARGHKPVARWYADHMSISSSVARISHNRVHNPLG